MPKLVGKKNRTKSTTALDGICSAIEASQLLGLTTKRVSVFCNEGRIMAKRIGRDWAIDRESLEAFAELERKPGNYSAAKRASEKSIRKKRARGR